MTNGDPAATSGGTKSTGSAPPDASSAPQPPSTPAAAQGGPLSGGLGVVVFIVLFGAAAFLTYRTLSTAEPEVLEPRTEIFKCAETGETFEVLVRPGDKWPIESPFSKKLTGYPTEACWWTAEGGIQDKPTYVILNDYLGTPGDTICPDCGQIVLPHNPRPEPGDTPPSKSAIRAGPSTTAAETPPTNAPAEE